MRTKTIRFPGHELNETVAVPVVRLDGTWWDADGRGYDPVSSLMTWPAFPLTPQQLGRIRAALDPHNPAAVSLGRLGGLARAAALTPRRRSEIAKQGSDAAAARRAKG